jgi:hypothetical protein
VTDEYDFREPEPERATDPQLTLAKEDVRAFFNASPAQVFYSRQIEVRLEDRYFHWITNRAIRELIADGEIKGDTFHLRSGGDIHLLWNKAFRYYRRSAKRVMELVEMYSASDFARLLGYQGEMLVIEAFARAHFKLIARNANEYLGKKWTASSHDVDFVYEKDGFAYVVSSGAAGRRVRSDAEVSDVPSLSRRARSCSERRAWSADPGAGSTLGEYRPALHCLA